MVHKPTKHKQLDRAIDAVLASYDGPEEINSLESAALPNKRAVIDAFNHLKPADLSRLLQHALAEPRQPAPRHQRAPLPGLRAPGRADLPRPELRAAAGPRAAKPRPGVERGGRAAPVPRPAGAAPRSEHRRARRLRRRSGRQERRGNGLQLPGDRGDHRPPHRARALPRAGADDPAHHLGARPRRDRDRHPSRAPESASASSSTTAPAWSSARPP